MENTTKSITHFVDMELIPNSPGKRKQLARKPMMHTAQITPRSGFRRLADLKEDLKPTMASSMVEGCGQILSAYSESLGKDGQSRHYQYVSQTCRKSLQQHILEKMSFDHVFVRLQGQEESRYAMVNILISEIWEGPRG